MTHCSEYMKYLLLGITLFATIGYGIAQGSIPETFFNGKSVVLVSSDPASTPPLSWQEIADSLHHALVEAGADPVSYFELEQLALSEATQASYAKAFTSRQIKNIILITRQKNQTSIHVSPFSGDDNIIVSTSLYGLTAPDISSVASQFASMGRARKSLNLLVLDIPEFPQQHLDQSATSMDFLARNPLNLDVFKLGIPLEGSSAQAGIIANFRYDLFGKSAETILAEQAEQKSGIQSILEKLYPYQVEYLTEAKTNRELITDRVQFILTKVEGREADLMRSMGLEPESPSSSPRIVVKYYIKLLVRNESYIGPEWDADPDWRISLENFLKNLKK